MFQTLRRFARASSHQRAHRWLLLAALAVAPRPAWATAPGELSERLAKLKEHQASDVRTAVLQAELALERTRTAQARGDLKAAERALEVAEAAVVVAERRAARVAEAALLQVAQRRLTAARARIQEARAALARQRERTAGGAQ